jgi:hypothetical protein
LWEIEVAVHDAKRNLRRNHPLDGRPFPRRQRLVDLRPDGRALDATGSCVAPGRSDP